MTSSMNTLKERFWSKVDRRGNCWLWTGAGTRAGYGQLRVDGCYRPTTHVAWYLNYGQWPKHCMCHTCDNPPCVRVSHLFDGTYKDNMEDAMRKGHMISSMKGRKRSQETIKRMTGWKHTRAARKRMSKAQRVRQDKRLSPADIRAIRAATCFQRITAARYGVCQAMISYIKSGRTYP